MGNMSGDTGWVLRRVVVGRSVVEGPPRSQASSGPSTVMTRTRNSVNSGSVIGPVDHAEGSASIRAKSILDMFC